MRARGPRPSPRSASRSGRASSGAVTLTPALARDGEEFLVLSMGQDWLCSWYPASGPAPGGKRHGSEGLCFTGDGLVVFVAQDGSALKLDGRVWTLPAGRPEGDE